MVTKCQEEHFSNRKQPKKSTFAALFAGCCVLSIGLPASAANIPEKLQGLPVSGTALQIVAEMIDPDKPLGTCEEEPNGHELRVILPNVRNGDGNIRLSVYRGVKKEWMAKGTKLVRFDVPATAGEMVVCMPLPLGAGAYALGLYHDENADTDYGISSEGYGFSNNAKKGWISPAPFKKVVFTVTEQRTDMEIRIRY